MPKIGKGGGGGGGGVTVEQNREQKYITTANSILRYKIFIQSRAEMKKIAKRFVGSNTGAAVLIDGVVTTPSTQNLFSSSVGLSNHLQTK